MAHSRPFGNALASSLSSKTLKSLIFYTKFGFARPLALTALAGLLVSCGDGDDATRSAVPAASAPNTYSALYTQVFGNTTLSGCSAGECHSGSGDEGGPSFRDKAALHTAMTTKTMSELNWDRPPFSCDTFKMINANNAEASVVVGSVVPSDDPNGVFNNATCAASSSNHSQIEGGKVLLTGDKAKGLVEWIRAGAPNN